MDHEFWRSRWAAQQIGFHEGAPNAFLRAHAARFDGLRRVLVPLSGKSEDVAYLAARGHAVIGVELVEAAVRAFFAEHDLAPAIEPRGAHTIYTAGDVTLIAGDWFTATPALVGPIDAVYDRAALIAMPPALRPRYVAQLRTLAPGAPGLTIAFEYPQDAIAGPPFSVGEAELRSYYADVELLAEQPMRGGPLEAAGVSAMERCYAVQVGAPEAFAHR